LLLLLLLLLLAPSPAARGDVLIATQKTFCCW
jgi:hypothetical protein